MRFWFRVRIGHWLRCRREVRSSGVMVGGVVFGFCHCCCWKWSNVICNRYSTTMISSSFRCDPHPICCRVVRIESNTTTSSSCSWWVVGLVLVDGGDRLHWSNTCCCCSSSISTWTTMIRNCNRAAPGNSYHPNRNVSYSNCNAAISMVVVVVLLLLHVVLLLLLLLLRLRQHSI